MPGRPALDKSVLGKLARQNCAAKLRGKTCLARNALRKRNLSTAVHLRHRCVLCVNISASNINV